MGFINKLGTKFNNFCPLSVVFCDKVMNDVRVSGVKLVPFTLDHDEVTDGEVMVDGLGRVVRGQPGGQLLVGQVSVGDNHVLAGGRAAFTKQLEPTVTVLSNFRVNVFDDNDKVR